MTIEGWKELCELAMQESIEYPFAHHVYGPEEDGYVELVIKAGEIDDLHIIYDELNSKSDNIVRMSVCANDYGTIAVTFSTYV